MEQTPNQQGGANEATNGDRPEQEPDRHPRIYVASLSDYNAGILHGEWIYADSEPESLQEAIDEMLDRSPTTEATGEVAEEWAIHDFEGFIQAPVSEYESLTRVSQLAQGIVRFGEPFSIWWAQEERADTDGGDVFSQFEEQFAGEYGLLEEFGEQLLDDMGASLDIVRDMPESLRQYVRLDVEAFVNDLRFGGDISVVEFLDRVYVFWPE